MGNEIKFKPATFYLGIADHLAKVVEGLKPEDMDAERGGGDPGVKRGHGKILDTTPHGVAQEETKQAPVTAEEGLTGPPMKELSSKGKTKVLGPVTTSGPSGLLVSPKSHDKATDAPPPTTVTS